MLCNWGILSLYILGRRSGSNHLTVPGRWDRVILGAPHPLDRRHCRSLSAWGWLGWFPVLSNLTPTAAKTDDMNAPSPSKLTSVALDTKPAQPQTVDKTTTPEPEKGNGSDTVPPASDAIEGPAAKKAVRTPNTGTAKADLEAALQALNSKEPETNPTIPTPTESGNGADQADAVPQKLLDPNAQAPLGDLTQNGGLGCTEKECPNCTALVPMDADGCGCGFAFPTKGDAMPSLSLTDSDVEALEKRKKSSGISHLG